MPEIVWSPTPEQIEQSRMREFQRFAAERHGAAAVGSDYDGLYAWSIAEREQFWRAIWDFGEVAGDPGQRVLGADTMPGAEWFPDATLNFAANLLRRTDDAPAIVFRREDGQRRVLSFADLRSDVGRIQAALTAGGVVAGDRVAAYLPNIPEAITAMLACAAIGAVWSSCSPDFGVPGVLDRFGQIEPKVLLTVDGYRYKGKRFDLRPKVLEVLAGLPTVQQTVVFGYTQDTPDLTDIRHGIAWSEWLGPVGVEPQFAPLPFAQPLYILFSSGTTGRPKCIVHGAGGTLLQHLKEHALHTNLQRDEVLFYFTTTGWMMWNWLVSGLAIGATIVLFDGNPMHPGPEALIDMAAEERVNVFGTSAKFVDAIKKAGLKPADTHDLSALRTLCSTGSPLVPESFDYVMSDLRPGVQIASISGGTDIVSCFVLGCPVRPVRRGEIQCRGLGMAVEVWNPDGTVATVGEQGELVCTKAFPSAPVGFWNDPDGAKYRAAYFDFFDTDAAPNGVWRHGDWCNLTNDDGFVIYGRSDATLNPGGVRIGTAEIYREVEQLPEIEEAIVIGQDTPDGDQRIVLFCRMAAGVELTGELQQTIRTRIRASNTPRHVPAVICTVTDIPRTRSGKISELAVRNVVHGRPVNNTEALANPEALEQYAGRPELAI